MVTIELLKEPDISIILEWNKNRSADYLFQWAGKGYTFPLTREQILAKIASHNKITDTTSLKTSIGTQRMLSTEQIVFKIADKNTGKMIGTVELSKINRENKKAWVSRFLIGDENNRNMGYGSEALKKVIRFAHEKLGLKKLFLRVFDFNKNAISCYEKAGFRKIRFIEKAHKAANVYWNTYIMERKM